MNQACYTRNELLDFTLGRMQASTARSIESHLDICPVCEETVAILDDATDSLIRGLRGGEDLDADAGVSASPILERAMAELANVDAAALVAAPAAAAPCSSDAPTVLRDYGLLELLGYGGMGAVYRARHLRLDRMVALKLLPARRMQDVAAVTRFQREMRAIGQLDHPSIVRATDAGEVDGNHFLAMELVDGADLGRIVRQSGPIDQANACELVRLAAVAMQYAHDSGIIHRDLKPSNLMLTTCGNLKILDLGLALLASQSGTVDELTTVGQLMGTLDYMAPEQFGDSHRVDHRVDVYSLSATLYKLMSGRAPYSGTNYRTPLQKLKGIAIAEPHNILEILPELNPDLAALIHRGLSRDPDQRFATASEFAQQLGAFTEQSDLRQLAISRARQLQTYEPEESFDESQHSSAVDSVPVANDVNMRMLTTSAAACTGLGTHATTSDVPTTSTFESSSMPLPSDSSGGTSWRRFLITSLGLAGCLLFGLLIYVKTSQGTLTVQSPRDDLKLEILRAGKLYKQVTVNKGEASWKVGLGEYEVKLAEPADGLVVDNGQFSLRRGEEEIATISASPAETDWKPLDPYADVADFVEHATNVPRYENRTLEQWRDTFLHERSPNRRGQAVQAMLALVDDENLREVIDTIYDHSTYRERREEFKDETRDKANRIAQLIHDFVEDHTERKIYAVKRWIEEDSRSATGYAILLNFTKPNSAQDRQLVQQIIEDGLDDASDRTCITAATCAMHHVSWLPDVPGQLRRHLETSDSLQRKAQLAFLLTLLEEGSEAEVHLFTDLAVGTPGDLSFRNVGLAGLIWMGPAADSAVEPLLELFVERQAELQDEFSFYSHSSWNSLPTSQFITNNYFRKPPSHVEVTPLLGRGKWRGHVGKQRDAVVTALGCIGRDNTKVTEVLLKELTALRDQYHITWIADDFDNKRRTSHDTLRNCLVQSLTQSDPDRFPDRRSVWEHVIGPKRVPVTIKRESPWISRQLYDDIQARLEKATAEIPVKEAEYYRVSQVVSDAFVPIVRELHPVIKGTRPRVRKRENQIEFEFTFLIPRALAHVAETQDLVPVDSTGVALNPAWYAEVQDIVESLPIVDIGELKPVAFGERWDHPSLAPAILIASELRTTLNKSNLTTVRPHPEADNEFQIVDDSGKWVFDWGHAIGEEPIGEPTAKEKKNRLDHELIRLHRSEFSESTEVRIDLRDGFTNR